MEFEYKTINQAAKEAYDYIEARKNGTITGYKSGWGKLNAELLDGFEENTVNLICGASSSGKTLMLSQLMFDLHDLNKDKDFITINFNFEMLARTLMVRKMSSSRQLSLKQLLSADSDYKMTDKDLALIKDDLQALSRYNVFYVDTPQTIAQLKYIINQFWIKYKKPMVVSIDHSILMKKSSSDLNTTEMLYTFGEALTEIKKLYPIIIFVASQLNREIEDVERIKRPSILQFPKQSDISYASALFQHADLCLINHRPSQLNIPFYGPERWEVTENDIFWHILKNRAGTTPILKMIADFKHMRIVEDDYFETKIVN